MRRPMTLEYEHEQVKVYNTHFGFNVKVDKGLVRLLKLLWTKEYYTEMSCEGGRDKYGNVYGTWLCFLSKESFDGFMQLLHANNIKATDTWINGRKYKTYSVRFPKKYIKTLEKALKG